MSNQQQAALQKVQQADHLSASQKAYFERALSADGSNEDAIIQIMEELNSSMQFIEAKNRELEIEAALEKIRERAMAMQNSNELADLVGIVFKELKKLHLVFDRCIIMIFDPQTLGSTWWMANPEPGSVPIGLFVKYHTHPSYLAYIEAWKSRKIKWEYILEGATKKEWDDFLFAETEMSTLPGFVISGMRAFDRVFLHVSFNNFGNLTVASPEPFQPENIDILLRFAKVFDSTYTRFNDLKLAEAQARESQIQLALEKVRARTMAMQRSEELRDAAQLLFQLVKDLGVHQWACGYNIWEEDRKGCTAWMSAEGQKQKPFRTPGTEDVFLHFNEAAQRGETFYTEEISGEACADHYRYLRTLPGADEIMKEWEDSGMPYPTSQIFYIAFFKQGYLMFITYDPVPGMQDVFERFAAVFEQTYTRFLDLQKAEAQTREANIEAGLERVRSRTMAMQRSEELQEAATLLFHQVQELNIPVWTCGYNILSTDEKECTAWMSVDGGIQPSFKIPLTESPTFIHFYNSWRKGESFYIEELGGESLEDHYRYMRKLPGFGKILEEQLKTGRKLPDFQVHHVVNFAHGNLIFISHKSLPEAADIFKRFGRVFEQTYTRFLDLQTAEAQAREARTEAALERVRSRTMAMFKSNELLEIASQIFQQLMELDVATGKGFFGFGIIDEASETMSMWNTGFGGAKLAESYTVPVKANPSGKELYQQWSSLPPSQRKDHSMRLQFGPEEAKAFMMSVASTALQRNPTVIEMVERIRTGEFESHYPVWEISDVFFSHGFLTYHDVAPLTDDKLKVLQRFAVVFEQTYIRFLDLQKAEAQALEATKRASIDRVRAEIASMRTTTDLEKITPLIWNELTTLGVLFIRCGVFIMDEKEEQIQTFLSNYEGKAIATFRLPYSAMGNIPQVVAHWRRRQIFKDHWDEAEFRERSKELLEQGNFTSNERYQAEKIPTNLHLHFLPFLQGMLYVGTETPLNEEELQLAQNLADAFATAYARYEDFNRLESAKKQIEKTLTDLKQAQTQLVQAEKMASLGQLTAGIAHEIQNPLNFVNNFSELNTELIHELKINHGKVKSENGDGVDLDLLDDIEKNLEKIRHHGKRAEEIVKGMLMHSRTSTGQKEPTDINALCDEYLRLAFHGLRAKDKEFNAEIKTDFDPSIGRINLVPQDMGRVLLNLLNNAFYAVNERKKKNEPGYQPRVEMATKAEHGNLRIEVKDNGPGIPEKIRDKIFQPFFTTKPSGQGTGLGLSLTYDIIDALGGNITVESNPGGGARFTIELGV